MNKKADQVICICLCSCLHPQQRDSKGEVKNIDLDKPQKVKLNQVVPLMLSLSTKITWTEQGDILGQLLNYILI